MFAGAVIFIPVKVTNVGFVEVAELAPNKSVMVSQIVFKVDVAEV